MVRPRGTTARAAVTAGLLAAALLTGAGCDGGAGARPDGASGAGSTAGGRPGPRASVGFGALPAPAPVTLAFAGDVHFTGRTASLLRDPRTAFGPIAGVLSVADLTMVNLETAVTTRGAPEPKQFHFRAPASAFPALRQAGVDVASLANNHVLDYGRLGLADTLAAARSAGLPVVGAGADASRAYAPYLAPVNGTTVAFLAFSQVHELESAWRATGSRSGVAMAADTARATAAVRAARARAALVVVYVHWGREGYACPTAEMRAFAAALAAAGADVIVGTHAHLLLGAGWLGRTYVSYGLGNFLWWYNDAYSNDTGVLQLTFSGRTVTGVRFVPALISRTTGQPVPAGGAEASRISSKLAGLRRCTGLAASPPAAPSSPPPAAPAAPARRAPAVSAPTGGVAAGGPVPGPIPAPAPASALFSQVAAAGTGTRRINAG